MRLSDIPLDNITLIRDGVFEGMTTCESSPNMPIFVYISEPRYISFIKKNKDINCVITTAEIAPSIPETMGLCVSGSPKNDFFMLHNRMSNNPDYVRPRFDTKIGENCSISHLASISEENVIIGKNVIIEEFVSIKPNVTIGNGTIIRAGSVIGGSGYEFKRIGDEIIGITHLGGVMIGDNVEILCNACVAASLFPWDDTVIGSQSKIDNLVHIAHACKLGNRNFVVAGAVLCGSVVTEDDVYIGPNATVARVRLKACSKASLGSVVIRNVSADTTVSGNFAVEHSKLLHFIATNVDKK